MGDYDPDKEYQEIENKIDKPLISCTKMSKYFWFPFITPVFITIRDIMFNKTINENDEINFNLVYMISISTFLFLAGIIYFIIDFRVFIDRQRTKSILKKDPKRHIKQTNKLEITFILLLMSVSFAVYIFSVPLSVKHIVLEKRQYTLFLIVFLSKFLLKKKIARHQKLSLCVAFCGFILLSISTINKMPGNDIWVNGVSFIGTVFYAIHYVYLEFLNKRDDFEIYFCYMTVGIFSIISSFIGFIIYYILLYKNLSTLEDGLYFYKNSIASEYYFYRISRK